MLAQVGVIDADGHVVDFVHGELEEQAIPQAAALLGEDQLFCACDYPHEPKDESPEAIARFRARTDVSESLKRKLLEQNPKRMYRQG